MKRISLIAAVTFLTLAAPAAAEKREFTYSVGPITVGPYQVKQSIIGGVHPGAEVGDGFITRSTSTLPMPAELRFPSVG